MQPEDFENIFPAICDNPSNPLSSKDFQRMLYTWFEERGLISDLRSYLRVLMINELRNKSVGKIEHKNFSLTKQAFCLVIAEHLLREGCYYTLSIFSTEVPGLINQLPVSLFDAHSKNENWRFDEESLLNVLELIGISRNSKKCLKIVSLYFKNHHSLLTCLVNSKNIEIDLEKMDKDGDYLDNVLRIMGLPSNMIDNVKKKIYESINQQSPKERQQMEEMEKLLIERNNQIKLLVEDQIKQKKENKKIKTQLIETQKRLKNTVLREKNLNLKETEIRKKLDEVARLQRSLEKTIVKDKSEVCLQKHCNEVCQSMMEMNEELKNKIEQLEETNRGKILEIERLNSRISSLTKDLHNSKVNIEFLNACLVRSSQMNLSQNREQSPPTEESSESFTAEILKQVRSRLSALEHESEELNTKFKKLKTGNFVTK